MNKFLLNTVSIFTLVILIAVSVNASKIENIQCVGNIQVQVSSIIGNSNYSFTNCQSNDITKYEWTCSCKDAPNIINLEGKDTVISVRLQYYIDTLRPIPIPNITHPTTDEIYNQGLKRVETRIIDTRYVPVSNSSIDETNTNVNQTDIVLGAIAVILLFAVFIAIVFMFIFMGSKTMKRWLGVDENKPMTTWEIITAIFSRKNIKRKEIIKIQQQPKQTQVSEITTEDKSYEDEVNNLLKDL